MAGKRRTPRGRGHARQLDRGRILEAAQAVARSEGPAAVTMRGIARALDVDVAALYWHFENKAALLEALSDRAAGGVPLPEGPHEDWRAEVRELCRAIRARIHAQPELRLAQSRAFTPFTTRCLAALGRALSGSGLSPETTLFAAQTLLQTILGVVASEIAQATASPDETRAYVAELARSLPEPLAKTWVEMARRDPQPTFESFFEEAIGLFVAGIEARGT